MSVTTFILGESGTGKTASMRNLKPEDTALIQVVRKPLPFKPQGWVVSAEQDEGGALKATGNPGNIYVTDDSAQICAILPKIKKDIIVIDDFQYIMANEFMRGVTTEAKGNEQFMKFNKIARHAWDILQAAANLPDNKRVYILSHTQTDDFGKTKAKTIGKLLDEKITLEGLFTIVLKTEAAGGKYVFHTQNSGSDTVKSPMGLFDVDTVDNDLSAVDNAIRAYYGITTEKETANVQTQ